MPELELEQELAGVLEQQLKLQWAPVKLQVLRVEVLVDPVLILAVWRLTLALDAIPVPVTAEAEAEGVEVMMVGRPAERGQLARVTWVRPAVRDPSSIRAV